MKFKQLISKIRRLPDKEALEYYWKTIIFTYKKAGLPISSKKWKIIQQIAANVAICLNFCRGGGKTLIGAHYAVFRAIKYGEVMWAADSRGQLTELFKHLKTNPFIKKFKASNNRQFVELLDGTVIHTICLTEEAFLGKHVLTLVLDEVARMDQVNISGIRKCLLKGGIEVFLSTPVKGSFYEDLCNIYPTIKVTYLECGEWIDIDKIQKEMKLFPSLIAHYNREYLCEFTALDGAVFPNVEFISQAEMNAIAPKCINIRQGMDLNTAPGHVGIRVGDFENKTYILDCQKFDYGLDYSALKTWCSLYPTEVESGGANTAFIEQINFSNVSVNFQPVPAEFWFNRIGVALFRPIYVVKESKIGKDLLSLEFKKDKVDMNPHHWIAAFLHAIGAASGTLCIPNQNVFTNRRRVAYV